MTPAEIAALVASIRARADAATPGPWVTDDGDIVQDFAVARQVGPHEWERVGIAPGETLHEYDAEFIAHAREDVPTLLDLIETLTGDLAKAEARRDLAEQTIADAPHDWDCRFVPANYITQYIIGNVAHECTCWKAGYDAAKEAL